MEKSWHQLGKSWHALGAGVLVYHGTTLTASDLGCGRTRVDRHEKIPGVA